MTDHEDTRWSADGSGETADIARDAANAPNRDKPTIDQLEAAILTLRPPDRAIFLAHRLDQLSYRQIAEITGLPIRQVEKAMVRAIGDLSRALRGKPPQRHRWWPF